MWAIKSLLFLLTLNKLVHVTQSKLIFAQRKEAPISADDFDNMYHVVPFFDRNTELWTCFQCIYNFFQVRCDEKKKYGI